MVLEGRSIIQDAVERDFEMRAEEEGDVGQSSKAVKAAYPGLGASANDIPSEGREDVPVAEHQIPRLEQRQELALVAVGKIGGVDEGKRGRRQQVLLLALAGGAFDQCRRIPLAEEDFESAHLQPALEEVNLGGFARAIEPLDGDEPTLEAQFRERLRHFGEQSSGPLAA